MQDRAQFGAQYSRWEVVAGVGLKLGKNDVSSLVEGSQILGFKRPTDETTIGESVAKHDAWRVLFFQNRTPLRAGREEGCAGAKEQLGSMAIAAQHLRQRLRWEWSAWVRCHGRQVPRLRASADSVRRVTPTTQVA